MSLNPKKHTLRNSFRYAIQGCLDALRSERNMRIHFLIAFVAIAFGIFVHLPLYKFALIIMMIGTVIVLEMLNTVAEYLVDLIVGETQDERARIIKDIAAGTVLVSAVIAIIVGVMIYLPYVLELFR